VAFSASLFLAICAMAVCPLGSVSVRAGGEAALHWYGRWEYAALQQEGDGSKKWRSWVGWPKETRVEDKSPYSLEIFLHRRSASFIPERIG
jgi:hypothetical protein